MMDSMKPLRDDHTLKELYICDVGLNKKNESEFVELLAILRRRKVKVTYIDHHDLNKKIINQLEKLKVRIIHDTNECTAVQVYNAYKSKLNDHAAFVAACAAITDYMDDRPLGSKLLQIFDRQFTLISATVLTYNIVGHQNDPDYLLYLVDELSESKYPHEIPNTYEFAQIQVQKLADIISKVKNSMKIKKNLGYMEIKDSGASGAVNFVLGLSGKDVGVAYKERADYGIYAVSVRGSKNCKVHLGKIVNKLSTQVGGSGGGHDKACGASIPKSQIVKFVNLLNTELSK
jgi:RecJ-like exonuclease